MTFKVCINEGERYQIQEWVLKHKDIETGGDLFGLWLDNQTAVVQFVLGPGKESRRTTTSFFQDVNYLHEAGTYLTKHHGLCNVGQWHSHHRINLAKPSVGDENTVWNNMPNLGLDRYIVFIANITNSDTVTINCFLFQIENSQKRPVQHGKFEFLKGNSPLRVNEKVLEKVHCEAESFNAIPIYEKEMRYNCDEDIMENLNINNENERVIFTGKFPEVSATSIQQENIRYICARDSVNTEELNKDKSNKQLQVSVYHSSTAEGERREGSLPKVASHVSPKTFFGYGTHDSKQGTTAKNDSSSRVSTNQRYLQQNYTGNGQQSTNTTKECYKLPASSQATERQQKKYTGTTPISSDQSEKYDNCPTAQIPTQTKREHTDTTTTATAQALQSFTKPLNDTHEREPTGTEHVMSKQYAKSHNPLTTPQTRVVKKAAPKWSESRNLPNRPQNESKQEINIVTEKGDKIAQLTKVGYRWNETPTLTCKGTESQDKNVTVTQPGEYESFNRSSRKRKSGDYDNVKYDNDSHQPKNSRPNSAIVNNLPSKDNLEILPETSETPSGTIKSIGDFKTKFAQKEETRGIVSRGNTWTSLFNSMCCGMRKLRITEPEEKRISKSNAEEATWV